MRELWRMRKRLFAWGARGSLCSVQRPETDKWETRQLAAQKRVSIGTLPSLDEKKAKAVQAQSAKTEIEKTRQSVLMMLSSLRSERACFEQGTKTVFF